ncbi:MAG: SMI1/KNR4 family protein [Lachnospiraceae bacterium]|nr:SMI1/KNR4 family protein [Lachnospiraceae bacterium]MDE6252050.1 SMI1/KNR4 family protein [Lachnospiraceae bacterium]
MNIAQKYVDGLKKAYYENGGEKQWNNFEKVMHGASKGDIEKLRVLYPDIPNSLLQLLEIVDGTYWRKYAEEEVTLIFLGSDIEEYPYYLLSAQQMIDTKDNFRKWGDYLINREFDDIPVDEGICDDLDKLCWLHFSDCVNNGGTSQLFIDFSPSAKGKKGQVLRYLHDPDELEIVAESFDAYLQMIMDEEYDFITEDSIEE